MNQQHIVVSPVRHEERYDFHKYAKQADGAVWFQEGNTVMLATVTYDDEEINDDDFLPLTVQYIEKTYAAGKFPGGFVKRENKPSDFETLTARVIDRTLRPLFPKGLTAPILITVMTLSCDEESDLQRTAVLAAQAALYVSSLPAKKSVAAVRVAKIDGELVINPSLSELRKSSIDLFVCGSKNELLMIEMQSLWSHTTEISEDELVQVIGFSAEHIARAAAAYEEQFAQSAKPAKTFALKSDTIDENIAAHISGHYAEAIREALFNMSKSERGGAMREIAKQAAASYGTEEIKPVTLAVEALERQFVRDSILNESRRADGRRLDEVRLITIETNVLPKAHGSAIFTRGQTQALVVTTLGGDSDRQSLEKLTAHTQSYDKLMLHYNFPGFSVGEVKRIGSPGRRELGHGNLAKRAIESQIDPDYDNTIRIVSEILESNGSSSMATVCGATLSLKAAAVPMKKLVAGVAMGLVTENDRYAVLTDITGLEDHNGDMDFKVAGTKDGITALQMDIKLGGLPLTVLKDALEKAKTARLEILDKIEQAVHSTVINHKMLPGVESFKVDPRKMVDIIGKAGATIRDLVDRYGVTIDLEREAGGVKVRGNNAEKLAQAVAEIRRLADEGGGGRGAGGGHGAPRREAVISDYTPQQELSGKIVKIVDFGMFVELPDSSQGLVHISKVGANGKRIAKLTDHFKENDTITVIFEGQDERKKIALGLKDKIE